MNKVVVIVGGIIGIFAALLWVFEPSLGWWEVSVDAIVDGAGYITPFGYGSNTINSNIEFHGPLLLIGGILFISSSLLAIIFAIKEKGGLAIMSAFIMAGGLGLFCYGLVVIEDFENILSGLSFLTGADYIVFFGSENLGILGFWAWRLGNGFFIAIGAFVVTLIGALIKR
ncbi:MAG: hypothetical protein ACFFDY_12600 [Candidatus Thorarchaeota archaeon]